MIRVMTPESGATQGRWQQRAKRLALVNKAALAIAGDLDLDRVLLNILATARGLAHARYGALGVPDGGGGFDKFLTVGISEKRAALIGDLPRYHGVLGVLLAGGNSIRVADITRHPQFSWYPGHHPEMREFLGVPIRHRGETLGEIYLSGTRAGRFSAADQEIVEMLAVHAGIAIATARLYAAGQELAIVEERNRVARDLHDAVSQTLFSMTFEARAAALKAREDPAAAVAAVERLGGQAAGALGEMRSLVYALRPKSLERDGLATTLRDHVEALRRAHPSVIDVRVQGQRRLALEQELALMRVAQEAIQNALKHSGGAAIQVDLRQRKAGTELTVRDTGPGFDIDNLPRTQLSMGLVTMRERATAIGAALTLTTAPGEGTEVRIFLPASKERAGA